MMAQLVDSQQQELSVEEILDIVNWSSPEPMETARFIAMINAELQMPNTLFIRQGNTLFIIHKADRGVGLFRALNADTARNFLANSVEFIKACHKMGFDTMATQFSDASLLNIFRFISENPPIEGMGYEAKQLNDGSFYVTVKTGPVRGAKK
jgi:hypothetical protein